MSERKIIEEFFKFQETYFTKSLSNVDASSALSKADIKIILDRVNYIINNSDTINETILRCIAGYVHDFEHK